MFIRRIDTAAEAPILWPPDAKSRLIGQDSDAGKDLWEGEKVMTVFIPVCASSSPAFRMMGSA